MCHVYSFNKRVGEEKVVSVKSGYMIPRLTDGKLIRAGLNEGMTELIAEHIYVESKIREGSSKFKYTRQQIVKLMKSLVYMSQGN